MKGTTAIRRMLKYLKPYSWLIVICAILGMGTIVLSLALPYVIGQAVDTLIGVDMVDFPLLGKYCISLAVILVVMAIVQWVFTYIGNYICCKSLADIRQTVFVHINKLPISYLDTRAHGDIISIINNDIEAISAGLVQGLSQLIGGFFVILFTLGYMFYMNAWITLIVIVLTPVSIFVAQFIAKKTQKHFAAQAKLRGTLTSISEEMLTGIDVLQASNAEETIIAKYNKSNEELNKSGFKAMFYSSLANPSTRFVNNIIYAIVGGVGACFAFADKGMTPGSLTTFLMYATQYTKPFNEIAAVFTELQNTVASAKRVFSIIDQETLPDETDKKELTSCEGIVSFDHVNFSYNKDKKLLQDIDLPAIKGKKIAIVGPTGCGKTTLINLLMRFYDVNDGQITIDGNNIQELTRHSLRANIGMVLQDTWLFSGTIRDNIAYGKPDASLEEVQNAAKLAGADFFISTFPDGYNTMLKENASNLSGGQKQLICIARIMLINPPILILDEATSNIDTRSEIKIAEAFDKISKGKTTFVVAHRLSTIVNSDLIIVMKDGQIVETGKHEDLLKNDGFYKELTLSQYENI